ncbi:MAG: glyceraldehyde 3-phosphate dehydrogenase, partial [Candidatus Aminicenantes bacterium]|nr:glyceraldehyde 3-phosphate dehydrogenase [Candidatus Aminicenantes bacterium]
NVGLRYESRFSLGPVPFWARPVVSLRGAPVTKYQNENTTLMEAEVDWNLYKRWTLVGFTGLGNAFSSFTEFDEGKSVRTLGAGFRYMIARKLGVHMGMDFAVSADDFAFYVVFGSAWLK